MVVVLKQNVSPSEVAEINRRLEGFGFSPRLLGKRRNNIVIDIDIEPDVLKGLDLQTLPWVERVVPLNNPFKLASREVRGENSVVRVGRAAFGDGSVTLIAGPCAVESRKQLLEAARLAAIGGAKVLRGGAFKPRTSPYSFQGLELEGLKLLTEAAAETGLATVTEVVDERSLEMALDYVDMVQVGARNMQNFQLLRAVGRVEKPVLLKRGMSATVKEWLMAAEYIMSEGNEDIVLCERGIRTFEQQYMRNTLDLSVVPLVKQLSHLPVIVDPSHATGRRDLIIPMARAAVAAGADGLIVEMHPRPDEALCDGKQSLSPDEFGQLSRDIEMVSRALGRVF
ncbi:MAG: 3-deoxy-7-phosphoheptulonate synthase [Peptococcaceae bacterium]|nr:3-deoxy-7-phosphoheptulonate synthase [Peptococcaceae bacterium]